MRKKIENFIYREFYSKIFLSICLSGRMIPGVSYSRKGRLQGSRKIGQLNVFFSEQIEIIEYVVQRAVFNAFRNIFRADSGKFPSMPHDPFFFPPPSNKFLYFSLDIYSFGFLGILEFQLFPRDFVGSYVFEPIHGFLRFFSQPFPTHHVWLNQFVSDLPG